MTYRSIVFVQNPEYDRDGNPVCPVAHWLENAWQGDDDSLVNYLSEFDQDGCGELSETPPWGTSDETFTHEGYIVIYNRALGYVGLCEVLS